MPAENKKQSPPEVTSRKQQYLVAPTPSDLLPMGVEPFDVGVLKDRLEADHEIELERTIEPRGMVSAMSTGAPGAQAVMVARMPQARAEALQRMPHLIVEPDAPLQYQDAFPSAPQPAIRNAGTLVPFGDEFKVTLVIQTPDGKPLPEAQVYVFGRLWPFQGTTNKSGKVTLTMFGERSDTVVGLYVKPVSEYWSIYVDQPKLSEGEDNLVSLPPLSSQFTDFPEKETVGWGSRAMKVDSLPPTFRGRGVTVAVVDSGAAAGHIDLDQVVRGLDMTAEPDNPETWKTDVIGHGSHCSGVIAGSTNSRGIIGIAPEAEVNMYKIFPGGRASDLIDALQRCVDDQVDVINLSLGSSERSELVQHKIALAREMGIACIAAAGNSAGPVQYPAAFPEPLAVSAIGKEGEFPAESYHATQSAPGGKVTPDGYFSAKFTCFGPEVDVCAPGVAIVSSVPPDNWAAWDGTSMAAPHVTGLSALILAHHEDFKGRFKTRDGTRVDRLFEIIKGSARRLDLGNPELTGAGLPDAASAFEQVWSGSARGSVAVEGATEPSSASELAQLGRLVEAARLGPTGAGATGPSTAPVRQVDGGNVASGFGRLRELMQDARLLSDPGGGSSPPRPDVESQARLREGIESLHALMSDAGF